MLSVCKCNESAVPDDEWGRYLQAANNRILIKKWTCKKTPGYEKGKDNRNKELCEIKLML